MLLGVKLADTHLDWDNHIDYIIIKLNSRIGLLKRAKKYLNLSERKLLYNALIKPILEYCCSVWGNTKKYNLLRLLRIQRRCAPIILDANISASSVDLFSRLGWIPIENIIELRKLCVMHNTVLLTGSVLNTLIISFPMSTIDTTTKLGRQLIMI